MSAASITGEQVPMPAAIANLPRWRGIPVPCTATVDSKGVPDFRVSDHAKWMRVVAERRCGICGEPLRYWLYFLGSPRQVQHRSFWDPPMHEDCAPYSAAVCRFLNADKDPAVAAHVRARHADAIVVNVPNKGHTPSALGLLQARRYTLVEGAPPQQLRAEGVAGCEWLRLPWVAPRSSSCA